LLAACVAIAASIGAVGGSLSFAKFGPTVARHAAPVAAAKEPVADEIKGLKDSITQLRTHMKSLSDNVAALKTTVNTTTAATNQQSAKITEALERIEKAQAEQKKLAAQAAPETTGSISQKQAAAVPMVLGDPPTTLKPPTLHDYIVRRVYDGAALIEGRNGMIEVEPGSVVPGIGRIEAIRRQDGRWVVVTARGLIVQR
jgi:TolA-binding protein